MAENVNISPEMINNLVNMLKNNNSNSSTTDIDMETIMKIKSIMELMNKKDDPKSNLLYSLKPYLRKSKQAKLDQYVNLLRISQVTTLFNNKEGDSK